MRYWKRVVPIAIIRRKFCVSKLKSPSRLSTNCRNTAFGLLEASTRVADVPRSFECNEQTIYRLQTRFRQPDSENGKSPLGRPRKTMTLEVRFIVTSTWRNRFMAACKLLKHLRHVTGMNISDYTARNCLMGARLILSFEIWILILTHCVILMKIKGVLLDFSLTVKAATLISISRCGSTISSAKEGKSGFIYHFVKS